ncbi:hypothetical protein L1267_12390 [Pseudoalteromonas sp. OFAV1]|uniref:hypothetical protein n=1 Tax=Pseudoalteromonas sp. OFAV1 TaxID=2908892 RepID=UPI001F1BCE33|nr:hypothetical protein [Pseudoalteromonas sp. OFAV1]MCF2901191.1 hypothetical protein [Pseudoalteromonas sp. OFAV1]
MKIDFTNKILNSECIVLTSAGTSWFNHSYIPVVSTDELLSDYKLIIKMAKEQGIKVAYTRRIKHRLTSLADKYALEHKVYHAKYQNLLERVTELAKDNYFIGPTIDNPEIKEAEQLSFDINNMYRNGKPLGEMRDIAGSIKEIKELLQRKNNCSKISI